MWVVFVVVAAVVLLGVAAVAVGRGDGLEAAAPDRPPAWLPARTLTPDDLAGLRLAVGLRGYRMDQVDAVLERLQAEIARRDERIERLESAARGVTRRPASAPSGEPPPPTDGGPAGPHPGGPDEP